MYEQIVHPTGNLIEHFWGIRNYIDLHFDFFLKNVIWVLGLCLTLRRLLQ